LRRNHGEHASEAGGTPVNPLWRDQKTASARDRAQSAHFLRKSAPTKPFFTPHVVVLKQTGNVVAACTSGGRVMSTIEDGSAGSESWESWDPAIWSIGTVLGVAIVYLACLT
jgi:hypothetical protein